MPKKSSSARAPHVPCITPKIDRDRSGNPFLVAFPGDPGPLTAAQLVHAVIADVPYEGESVRVKRREAMIDRMRSRGQLGIRQFDAAERLQNAAEALYRSPPTLPTAERVDRQPDPHANVAIQTDRVSKFVALFGAAPKATREVLWHVVVGNRSIAHMPPYSRARPMGGRIKARRMDELRDALNAIADHIGLPGSDNRPAIDQGKSGRVAA
ncbi:MAG: hypothetical protein AAFR84_01235 [Pseudomonadota bacterium]